MKLLPYYTNILRMKKKNNFKKKNNNFKKKNNFC